MRSNDVFWWLWLLLILLLIYLTNGKSKLTLCLSQKKITSWCGEWAKKENIKKLFKKIKKNIDYYEREKNKLWLLNSAFQHKKYIFS